MEAGIGGMWPQAKEHLGSPEAGRKARKDSSLEPSEGTLLLTPGFSASGLRIVRENVERKCFCCFKPSGLWYFVMAAPGNNILDMPFHVACVVWSVAQLCTTLCDPTDCSPPGSSVHGILQARILEWFAMPFSRRSSQSRDQIQVSCIAGKFFTI